MNQLDPYDFGIVAVGGSRDVTIRITNSGDSIAIGMGSILAPPYGFKDGSYPGTGGNCGFSLPGGSGFCDIVVTFSPITPLALNPETLTVNYNDGADPQTVTKVLAAESRPAAKIDITEVDSGNFGTIAANGTLSKVFTLTNNGAVDATVVLGAAIPLPFVYTGGAYPGGGTCPTGASTLAPAASCTCLLYTSPSPRDRG